MAFTVNFPVDIGTFVILDYDEIDLNKPETLRGKVGTIACYHTVTQKKKDDPFVVMISGYGEFWRYVTRLDWLHIATDEEIELYKKVMGIE